MWKLRPRSEEEVELEALRAASAYGSGVRTVLRDNATAYGFSVVITATFGLVSREHRPTVLGIALFAAGAAGAFLLVDLLASRFFRRVSITGTRRVVLVSGALDVMSIMGAVGVGIGLATLPGVLAWPAAAGGATLTYLLLSGLDVLVARLLTSGDGG
jgi:hypothetical protein